MRKGAAAGWSGEENTGGMIDLFLSSDFMGFRIKANGKSSGTIGDLYYQSRVVEIDKESGTGSMEGVSNFS